MAAKSTYLQNKILDLIFGKTSYTAPSILYIGLFNANPTQISPSGTEASGVNYARVAVNNNTTNWPAASNGVKINPNEIEFTVGAGGWDTLTGYGIYDSFSAGNLLYYGTFDPIYAEDGSTINLNIEITES